MNNRKYYILNMFPYPSGDGLHVGHALGYVASDIFARYKKMKDFNVINPMGFDSFGLPTEQFAILTGQHPSVTTSKNVQHYFDQMKKMDLCFDWDRKVMTSDPNYYKWTQWIFIQMFNSFYCKFDNKTHKIDNLFEYFSKNGTKNIEDYVFSNNYKYNFTADQWKNFSDEKKYKISLNFRIAYLDDIEVNWCEELKTVLANDEVKDGISERGGYPVVKKKMKQWVLRITAFADRLLNNIEKQYFIQNFNEKIDFKKEEIKDSNVDKVFNLGIKKGLPIIKSKVITAIIKHWSDNKYLISRYKIDGSTSFLTGEIEDGESSLEALKREIREETGFVDIKKINLICKTKCILFVNRKNTNAESLCLNYYVELASEKQVPISEKEMNTQVYFFVDENEVNKYLTDEDFVYIFEEFKNKNLFKHENINKTKKIDWPESTKEMQRNWIGKSIGANIDFIIFKDNNFSDDYKITIFTSRPETIFGVTFLALSFSHEFVEKYVKNKIIFSKSDDKEGYKTNYFAINPINNEKIPIWVANYILSDYGTGAVMAVPDLDERDSAFAKKYNINVKHIFENDKFINSDFLNNLNVKDARKKVLDKIKELNIGKEKTVFKLRDAIFSRQRYWGEPIPIYYKDVDIDGCVEKLPFVIADEDLPLKLPDIDNFKPTGEAPLKRAKNWNYKGYELEVNTMPGWAGSSWYFIRYLDPQNNKEMCSKEKLDEFENVDLYLGGAEHAVGHLLYSRFYTKFLYDLGYINFEEPFKKLIHQGMILGESAIIYRNENCEFISSDLKCQHENLTPIHINVNLVNNNNDVDIEKLRQWRQDFKNAKFICNSKNNFICDRIVEKMSKSKYNVINPDDIIEKYSSDVLRMYLMFLGPIEQKKPWSTKGIEGIARFLKKINNVSKNITDIEPSLIEFKAINECIKNVEGSIENYSFNTAISSMMICINIFTDLKNISKSSFRKLLLLLKPFAPKTSKNIWINIFKTNIDNERFPEYDKKCIEKETFKYPVMINGKIKNYIDISCEIKKEENIKSIALNNDIVKNFIDNKNIEKIIIKYGKIISIVC